MNLTNIITGKQTLKSIISILFFCKTKHYVNLISFIDEDSDSFPKVVILRMYEENSGSAGNLWLLIWLLITWCCSFYWSSHSTHEDDLSSSNEVGHSKHIPFQSLDWQMFCDVLSKGKINSCNSFVSLLVAAEKSVCPISLGYKNST